MTFLTFLEYTSITVLIFLFVRIFWFQLYVIYMVIKVLWYITILSLFSMFIWIIIANTSHGLGWIFLYLFITYCLLFGLYVLITMDIINWAFGYLRGLISKLK